MPRFAPFAWRVRRLRSFLLLVVMVMSVACGPDIDVSEQDSLPEVVAIDDAESIATTDSAPTSMAPPPTDRQSVTSLGSIPAETTSPGPTSIGETEREPLALAVLEVMVVAPEYSSGYRRDFFPHWTVIDGCSIRDRVLIEESTSFAQVDTFGCRVVAGDWVSPFDGRMWDDPAELQIDHLVALKEAWESGAWAWSESDRRKFANDIDDSRPLNAVTGAVNQAKSDLEPQHWLPPLASARCRYVADWIAVKARWQLAVDGTERAFLDTYLRGNCPDQRLAPWQTVLVPVSSPVTTTTPTPTAPPNTSGMGSTAGEVDPGVYYANCSAARAAGVAPIYASEPGYRPALDRDGDGVACE